MVASMRVLLAASVAFLASTTAVDATHRQLKGSLADAPSVKLHVTFKRKAMKLHGQSEFDVYATPVVSANGASVLYNGYASFQDEDTDFTYTFVDGSGYLTTADSSTLETVQCLPPHTLPFDKILPALNEAARIPSAAVGKKELECASGNLFKTTFAGVHYAICTSGESGFTAVSSDLDIDVEYLDGPVSIEKPELSDGTSSCKIVAKPTSLTPTALALATGNALPASASRKLEEASHMALDETECQCLSTPRPCVFFHGLGNPNEEAELQDTPELTKKKFGDLHGHAPCCSTIKYAVLNTNDAGWRNDTLQQKFCDHSLSMSATSDVASGTIDNTIIVTHSMGGLVMAGALAKGKCKFSPSTSWVAVSAPMLGSMASDFLLDTCTDEDSKIAVGLFELLGQCPVLKSRTSTTYQGEWYSTPSIDAAYVAAQEAYRGNVTAAMCSDSFFGLLSRYLAPCILGGTVIPHYSKKNDGLVEFQSCLGGLDENLFGNNYLDRFYRPQLNHADTAFLNGEGILKDSQKPFKWFECLEL
uniref:GPI inositol-deacylase n=1 Tax=Phytophthora ramorum TaxID=164328 RepID=H3GWE9_PHYRM